MSKRQTYKARATDLAERFNIRIENCIYRTSDGMYDGNVDLILPDRMFISSTDQRRGLTTYVYDVAYSTAWRMVLDDVKELVAQKDSWTTQEINDDRHIYTFENELPNDGEHA